MPKQYIETNRAGKFYFKDPDMTILHRIDGPSGEYLDGSKAWCLNGKLHRLDGPAMEYSNGNKVWYVNGVFIFYVNRDNDMLNRMR